MDDNTLAPFFLEISTIAKRIRERYEWRIKQEIETQRRTIDIQIEKASDEKANRLASKKLEKMQAWIEATKERSHLKKQNFEQFKAKLFWLGHWFSHGRSATCIYIGGIIIFATLGFFGGINTPSSIACKSSKDICYLLRFDKSQVVLPQQALQLIQEYERSKTKPSRLKREQGTGNRQQ